MSELRHIINDLKLFAHSSLVKIRQSGRLFPATFLAVYLLILPAASNLFELTITSSAQIAAPTFQIISVKKDETVTIKTADFPASTTFTATMGPMGTRGVDGIVVGTVNSGKGGSFEASFQIPKELRGSYQIAVRLQSSGPFPYYSYNWFFNYSTTAQPPVSGPETSPPPVSSEVPSFKIVAVKKDTNVTIETANFPPNQQFAVTMGKMGTRGLDGISAGSFNSGKGGSFSETLTIPKELAGLYQISIRVQTTQAYPFYSYNWFYNVTTP